MNLLAVFESRTAYITAAECIEAWTVHGLETAFGGDRSILVEES